MGISEIFSIVFNRLKTRKILLLPGIVSFLITALLVVSFLFMTGSYDVLGELRVQYVSYNQATDSFVEANLTSNETNTTLKAWDFLFRGTMHREGFVEYAKNNGVDFWAEFINLLTPYNITLFVIFSFVILLSSYYLHCATYSLIGMDARNKKITLTSGIQETNTFFFRYAWQQILKIGIFILTMFGGMLALLPVIVAFMIYPAFGILVLIAWALLYIGLMILILFRFFYSTPAMFVDDLPAVDSIKKSNLLAKHNKANIFVIGLLLVAFSIIVSQIIDPLYALLMDSLFWQSVFAVIPFVLVLCVLAVVSSIGIVFSTLFLFHAYIDFKKTRNKK